jgi:D-glycero-D-manno-heptose 1,7-bisphosphate phosphatase
MKLAVLDKDGTLVLPKSNNKFVQNPTDQILMVGAVEGCQRLIDAGYVLAIASNQGGVEAGHKTMQEANSEMNYCIYLLQQHGIKINQGLYCPDFEGKSCLMTSVNDENFAETKKAFDDRNYLQFSGEFRKPNGGMLKALKGDEFEDCWMIGDREEDRLAAAVAGFSFLDADAWRKGASPWII